MIQIQAWQVDFHLGKLDLGLLIQTDMLKGILKLYTELMITHRLNTCGRHWVRHPEAWRTTGSTGHRCNHGGTGWTRLPVGGWIIQLKITKFNNNKVDNMCNSFYLLRSRTTFGVRLRDPSPPPSVTIEATGFEVKGPSAIPPYHNPYKNSCPYGSNLVQWMTSLVVDLFLLRHPPGLWLTWSFQEY